MIIDIYIEINEKEIITKVLEKNFHRRGTDLIILDAKSENIISIGDFKSQLEFKNHIREINANSTDEQINKFCKNEVEREKYRKMRSICKEDIKNDAYTFWQDEKNNYEFMYPFRVESFNPERACIVLVYYVTYFRKNCRCKFYDKFNYHIQFNNYTNLNNNEKSSFESDIKKRLPRSKQIIINNNNKIK